ncbi:NifU family protein [Tautonia plasticadhaerens]|uniref:Fe/S biogenesis protein NfuA n=1 Tax=Tautonia plasticadhaerens TaxID=2527974 RepID=A0A518GV61_9BACT|nr:NifU family protein [Tautonia plasticadhaerens]QDV32473.1 Fe/S biogenesis protein NfuA [Tautonia plasticadhaerens]
MAGSPKVLASISESMSIRAEPIDARRCRFVADRPLDPGRWAYFSDRSHTLGSPLADRLLAVDGVAAVLIMHDAVIVTRISGGGPPLIGPGLARLRRLLGDSKAGLDSWPALGKRVGAEIRRHVAGGEPAVSPAAHAAMPSPTELADRIRAVLGEHVNPVLAGHGGGVELVEVRDNVAHLRMGGGCQGCGLADTTLRLGVEAVLRDHVPHLGLIYDLTDHRAGTAPYHRPGSGRPGRSPMAGRRPADREPGRG